MCILIFSTTLVRNISHSKKKWVRYDKNVYWPSRKISIILVRFYWNLNFPRQIFEKFSNIKFHENSSSAIRVVQCGRADGQTDRHDEAKSRLSQFCERAKKKLYILSTQCIFVFCVDLRRNSVNFQIQGYLTCL